MFRSSSSPLALLSRCIRSQKMVPVCITRTRVLRREWSPFGSAMLTCQRENFGTAGSVQRSNDGNDGTGTADSTTPKRRLLENVTVLDLSRVLAGPYLTQMLGDLGATVIKVENTRDGDDTRKWAPPHAHFTDKQSDRSGNLSAYYLCANRNKKSICIDFATEEGQKLVLDLARRSNVLVENMKVGGLAKYGLDYESVKSINPSIVYCSITSFGQNSTKAHLPGYDFIAQAMSGIMSVTGPAEDEPSSQPYKVGMAVTDVMTGMYGAVGILSTLLHQREQQMRGEVPIGQHIDVSLFDVSLSMLVNQSTNWLVPKNEQYIERKGNAHPNITPYESMRTRDGFIALAVGNNKQFGDLCQAIDLVSMASDPRFKDNSDRVSHRKELKQIIGLYSILVHLFHTM